MKKIYILLSLCVVFSSAEISAQTYCSTAVSISVKPYADSCFTNPINWVVADSGPNYTPVGGCGVNGDDDWWGTFTATCSQTNLFMWGKSKNDFTLVVYTGTCASLTQVYCLAATGADDMPNYAVFNTNVGQTYYVLIHGTSGTTSGILCIYCEPTEPVEPFCAAGQSFEDGSGAGWTPRYGGYHLTSAPGNNFVWDMPNNGMPVGRFLVTSGAGRDCNAGVIPVVAPGGGTYSFRIAAPDCPSGLFVPIAVKEGFNFAVPGQPDSINNHAAAESMTYCFTVDSSTAGFGYKYATVMDDGNHPAAIQPLFEVFMLDPTGDTIQCGYYQHYPGDGTSPFHYVGDDMDVALNSGLCFTPWTDILTDLTGYAGQQVCITFRVRDCEGGGNVNVAGGIWEGPSMGSHGAYAYFDTYCIPMTVTQTVYCAAGDTMLICAPAGYSSYSWPPQPGLIPPLNQQCVNVVNPQPGATYTVNMVSFSGCPVSTVVTLTGIASISNVQNATCGSNNGSATATGTGGQTPYTYLWSTGQTTSTATGLSAGTYSVTVTDANGCSGTDSVTITQSSFSVTISSTNASCISSNGTASASPNGGSAPYTYLWSNGQTTSTATGLGAGIYTVTITDGGGCTGTQTVTITNGAIPVLTSSNTAVLCNGQSNGTATVSASSGTLPYTYLWNNGQTTSNATGLSAGTYTVTVTDADGCSSTTTVSITQPPALSAAVTNTNVSCNAGSNGSATLSPSGGTTPYSYLWSDGQTTSAATGLIAGNYTVTVTDQNGCTNTTTVSIIQPDSAVSVATTVLIPPSCGMSDGSAIATGSGGTGPYNYSWNSSPVQNTQTVVNLPAGNYTVTVTDASSCSATTTVILTNPNAAVLVTSTVNATCGMSNGSATVTPTGGTAPYTYQWSTVPVQNTDTATNLAPGTYYVTVTDQQNCISIDSATVVDTTSFTADAGPNQAICTGDSVTLTATGGTIYQWSTGASTASINVIPSVTTSYTVTISDATCTATDIVTVTVNPIPTANITGDTLICNGASAILTASGGSSYVWNTSDTTAAITVSPLATTTYNVTVNSAGCTSTADITVILTTPLTADAGNDTTINIGESAQLDGSGGVGYSWSPIATLSCSNCADPLASPLSTTTYILIITDANGCTDADTVIVTVDINCGEVFVPNAFSPNAEFEENQMECVYGNCIQTIEFAIFDRWGEKVFETTNPKECWNGKYKGKECNTGAFVYYMKATLYNGTEVKKQGNINLFR